LPAGGYDCALHSVLPAATNLRPATWRLPKIIAAAQFTQCLKQMLFTAVANG